MLLFFFTYSLLLVTKAIAIKCLGSISVRGTRRVQCALAVMPAKVHMGAMLCLLLSWSPAMPQDHGGHASTVLGPRLT